MSGCANATSPSASRRLNASMKACAIASAEVRSRVTESDSMDASSAAIPEQRGLVLPDWLARDCAPRRAEVSDGRAWESTGTPGASLLVLPLRPAEAALFVGLSVACAPDELGALVGRRPETFPLRLVNRRGTGHLSPRLAMVTARWASAQQHSAVGHDL